MAASTLSERMRAGGIVADPAVVIAEAKRAGLRLAVGCALLEKESTGGHNVFGHDRHNGVYIFPARDGTVPVTEQLYREYKQRRHATGLPQGVGPCQLTLAAFQDRADELGGCWKPALNIRVGFGIMADHIKRMGESAGIAAYNGSGDAARAYSHDLLLKAARWQSLLAGASGPGVEPPADDRLVRRGAHGPRVVKVTRRLSYVHSARTRAPYLDGARRRFDAEAVAALKAFQREHDLVADGVFGDHSARKLNHAVTVEKARRAKGGTVTAPPAPVKAKPGVRVARLPDLAHQVRHLDAETGAAWDALVEYGRRRGALLVRMHGGLDEYESAVVKGLTQMTDILLRIEGKVGEIATAEEHAEVPQPAVVAAVKETAVLVEQAAAAIPVVQAQEMSPPPPEGPVVIGESGVKPPERRLADLSEDELLVRIAKLDHAVDRSRAELIGRYAKVEKEIARVRPALAQKPAGKGVGRTPVARPHPRKPHQAAAGKADPQGGKVVVTKAGEHGVLVRRSKIALARFLAAKGNPEHAKLRRALAREARRPGRASVATPSWRQAVTAAQHLTGRPATGELDGDLVRVLQPYWPRDNAGKRVLRGTPGAWRTIPGQLSPNFNIKELACKDTAHTTYVAGLVREEHLTKKQAKARAKELAKRLERLRKLGGDRPLLITSAFRTKAYNATLTGSATNSAHTRGFACDTPPPPGISLSQHEGHVLSAFECGCGYYPPGRGNFIHGDFDHTLGGRRRWGH